LFLYFLPKRGLAQINGIVGVHDLKKLNAFDNCKSLFLSDIELFAIVKGFHQKVIILD